MRQIQSRLRWVQDRAQGMLLIVCVCVCVCVFNINQLSFLNQWFSTGGLWGLQTEES